MPHSLELGPVFVRLQAFTIPAVSTSRSLSAAGPDVPQRRFPTWLVGILYSASGSMNGFVAVALATLLTARGVSNAREATMTALILTPSYLSFLFTPLVDCGISRRTWAVLLAVGGSTLR